MYLNKAHALFESLVPVCVYMWVCNNFVAIRDVAIECR